MRPKHSRWIILCPLFIAFTLGCLFLPSDVKRNTTASQIYAFDPSTILQSLSQGNKDLFNLLSEEPSPSPESTSVTWNQEDYLLVAEALHRYVRNETLDGWKLTDMVFRLKCKDVSTGLQLGSFTFSKIIYEQKIPYRWVRNITIDPTDKEIFFTEEEYHREGNFTGITEWPSVDLAQIKISADDAIHIVENAGGINIRDDTGNNCNIFETFDIAGTDHQNSWVITYSANDQHSTTLLKVFINGFTGDYEIAR